MRTTIGIAGAGHGFDTLDVATTLGTKGDDTLQGGDGKDIIKGLGGNDSIDGGGGVDRLFGGNGDDTLTGGGGQDTVAGGAGNDLIIASAGGHQANQGDHLDGGDGFDTLSFQGIEASVFVDIQGNDASSSETGQMILGGFEGVVGGSGDDVIWGRTDTACSLDGGDGADVIHGRSAADTLIGGAGDDGLVGSGDTLIGGLGADSMSGGFHDIGPTTFVYTSLEDSTNAAPDRIDGLRGVNIIDLHLIDADTTQDGDQAFHLVSGGFTGHAGELQLVYDPVGDQTTLTVDVDGDAVQDMTITLSGDRSGFHHFVL